MGVCVCVCVCESRGRQCLQTFRAPPVPCRAVPCRARPVRVASVDATERGARAPRGAQPGLAWAGPGRPRFSGDIKAKTKMSFCTFFQKILGLSAPIH